MMGKEDFDEELKNRIEQVFDDYEDGTADEGWNRLREKYPEKKRRDAIFWWLGPAAALLLMALLFWLFQPNVQKNKAVKTVKQQKDTVLALKKNAGQSRKIYSSTQNPSTEKTFSKIINTKKTPVKTASGFVAKQLLDQEKTIQEPIIQQENQPKPETQKHALFTGIKEVSADSSREQVKIPVPASKEPSGQKQQIIAKTGIPSTTKPVVPKKTTKTEAVKKTAEKASRFSLGLYAGTHVNYATGSNNQLGLGAGFSTEFSLGKSFKLSAGLGLMQNNLSYNQQIPGNSLLAASTFAATPAPVSSPSTGTQTSNLKSMDARLLALDVPVNLTYTFLPGKNSISISAGISSNTFAKEVYDYHYSTSTSNTQNIKSFNNFNFANTLNLAVGFAYPLGKNKLQIEPFLKYPLGGAGSQQLLFGSAGINLKLNLQNGKNKSGKYF